MFNTLKNFSINNVQMYKAQNEDLDFSIVEIWALAVGNNSHKNPISKEVLERDANTFKGKFIIGKYDKLKKDSTTHVTDQAIWGYIDPNEPIEFKTKIVDGVEKEFVVVKGVLSKIYANDVVEMFRQNNNRTVSCEFSCNLQYEEDEYGRPIDEYGNIIDNVNPILGYSIHGITVLGLEYNPSIRGTEIKVKQFVESNNSDIELKEVAKKRFEQISNRKNDMKEDGMESDNKIFSESEDKEKDVVMEQSEEKSKEEEKEMAKEDIVSEDKTMSEDEDTKEEPKDEDEDEDKEEVSEGSEKDVDMGCNKKEFEENESEKKFSLDAYIDTSAILAMLENETEERRNLVNQVVKEFSAEEILKKIIEMSKENELLKSEKEFNDNEKKEKKFSAIMASVKGDLDEKTFSELSNEGKELALDQLGAFENKVKAFAYEATKNKKDNIVKQDNIMMFGGQDSIEQDSMDVFERISKK